MKGQPGYPDFLPASYQVLGPEQDAALDRILAINPATQTTVHPAAKFFVRTPNVRCRTRVTVFLVPDSITTADDPDANVNTTIIAGTGTLWVCERELGLGVVKQVPVDNVVGTGAAPLAIPTDTRLWGYSFEIETNGQELAGVFTPPNTAAAPTSSSKWHVSCRYESVQRLSDQEWNQFLGQYGIRVSPDLGAVLS